jgi:hypothetical protein
MTLSESRFFVRTENRLTIHPVVTGSLAGKVVLVLEFFPVASALVGTLSKQDITRRNPGKARDAANAWWLKIELCTNRTQENRQDCNSGRVREAAHEGQRYRC